MVKCIEFKGRTNSEGYGQLNVNGHSVLAHRYVWSLKNGPIPKGKVIMHTCHNPACVRLDHLEIMTQQENVHTSMAKGRWVPWNKGLRVIGGTCKNGHALTPGNVIPRKRGGYRCKECNRNQSREFMRKRRNGAKCCSSGCAEATSALRLPQQEVQRQWD